MKRRVWAVLMILGLVVWGTGCAADDAAVADGQAGDGDNAVAADNVGAADSVEERPDAAGEKVSDEGAVDGDTDGVAESVPVVRSTAYDTRVSGDEMVLHNSVRFGMTYDEVAALCGYAGEAPDEEYCSFECDGIWYGFGRDDAGELMLTHINVTEEAVDASIFRDIRIGDSIESVFARIPARDTELKKWAIQDLYGSGIYDEDGYACLEFIAMSYYGMRIRTAGGSAHITFSRDDICVKWIELYAPGM